jgi:HEPN domain-containing protein
MKPPAREWVDKAEADYTAALLLRKSRKKHARDIVCFHLQQCLEKYLKGRLEEGGVSYPKTHDLERLLDLLLPLEPLWSALKQPLIAATNYAVEVRYPSRSTTAFEANALLKTTKRIRGIVRDSLGLQ